jgi:hypothetical protein
MILFTLLTKLIYKKTKKKISSLGEFTQDSG